MPTYPFPTTNLVAAPEQSSFPSGTNFLVVTPDGIVGQTPVSLLPRLDIYLNVRAFGASGNGSSDDTAAIQACFSAATAGSTIVFPPGYTFVQRGAVTISVDRLTVIATGAKIVSDGASQDRKFNVIGRTGIVFRDLYIDGHNFTTLADPTAFDTYTPQNQPGAIYFKDAVDCEVTGCDFRGLNWPVTILGACENISVHDNRFASYMSGVYSYFSTDSGLPAPQRISVCFNKFYANRIPPIVFPADGSPRVYPPTDLYCTGAIKFRSVGSVGDPWRRGQNHVIVGNVIRDSGQMGIELQGGANDSIIFGNTIANTLIGISLSVVQRINVASNIVRNTIYTGIEIDGRPDGDTAQPSNDEIVLHGNVIDSRDEFGRPTNFVNNFGVILSHVARNVTISGGSIKYHKTAVAVVGSSSATITGVRITTNDESGYGGGYYDGTDATFVQGILISQAGQVDIIGCTFEPATTSYQRMVNIVNTSGVTVRDCTITSNNCPVYVHNSSNVSIEHCKLQMGSAVAGINPSFITVDSTDADCLNVRVANCTLVGSPTFGILLYAPAHTIGPVTVTGCDTTQASCSPGNRFLVVSASGSGSIGRLNLQGNVGPGDISEQHNIQVPAIIVTGTVSDWPGWETIICDWDTTINLQTAVGYNGRRKTVVVRNSAPSTVSIHPKSGETINGSTSDQTLTSAGQKITLQSDGANWVIVS